MVMNTNCVIIIIASDIHNTLCIVTKYIQQACIDWILAWIICFLFFFFIKWLERRTNIYAVQVLTECINRLVSFCNAAILPSTSNNKVMMECWLKGWNVVMVNNSHQQATHKDVYLFANIDPHQMFVIFLQIMIIVKAHVCLQYYVFIWILISCVQIYSGSRYIQKYIH